MKQHTKAISIVAATALAITLAACTDTGTSSTAGAGGGGETTASTSRGEGRAKGTKGMTSQRGELTTQGEPEGTQTGSTSRKGPGQ